MPIIQVHMLEGRDTQQKRSMVSAITDAVVNSLDVRPEQVRILIDEMPPEHFAVGGASFALRAERAARGVESLPSSATAHSSGVQA